MGVVPRTRGITSIVCVSGYRGKVVTHMKIPVVRLLPHNSPRLMCANREPWMGRHPLCEAMTAKMVVAFQAAVARGEYNAQGYTPNEWKAKMKREGAV